MRTSAWHDDVSCMIGTEPSGFMLKALRVEATLRETFRFVNCLSNPDDYVLSSDGESVRDSIARENLHDFSDTLPSPKYSLLASTDPI
ncbi:hypothetical protein CGCF413_v015609 [Colletotrichum fructicola]|nr:hypothetical protein CGCF413_v015609 [Colletotrichum fructicola]